MKKRYLFPLFVCLFLFVFILHRSAPPAAQTVEMPSPELLPPVLDEYEEDFLSIYEKKLLTSLREEGVPGAAYVLMYEGYPVKVGVHGVADVRTKKKVDEHTVFRLASLSKALTGLLAGQMVAKGLVNWNSPMNKFLPEIAFYSPSLTDSIQLKHLLSHTTGLPRHTYSNLLNMEVPYTEIVSMLKDVPPAHPIGTYHNYQNVIFSLAGDLLAEAGNHSYDTLLHQYILTPIRAEDASVGWNAFRSGTNIAMPHHKVAAGYARKELKSTFYEVAPAAGVNASITDLARLLQYLMQTDSEIFSQKYLDEVFQPAVPIHLAERAVRKWKGLESAYYAMGWRVLDYPELRVLQHSGYVNGYRTELAFSQNEKIGIAILTNGANYTVGSLVPSFFKDYRQLLP